MKKISEHIMWLMCLTAFSSLFASSTTAISADRTDAFPDGPLLAASFEEPFFEDGKPISSEIGDLFELNILSFDNSFIPEDEFFVPVKISDQVGISVIGALPDNGPFTIGNNSGNSGGDQTLQVDGIYQIDLLYESENGSYLGESANKAPSSSDGYPNEDDPDPMRTILNNDGGDPDVAVLASNTNETVIDLFIQEVREEETKVNNETFQILTIPGYAYTPEVGKPQIPVIRETIAIPDEASVQAVVLNSSYSTYWGYRVYPVQPPEIDSDADGGEFVIDEEFYSQDVFYPAEVVEVGDPAIWRDLDVVGLQINPITFNPATGELRVYDHITIKLEYYGGKDVKKVIGSKFSGIYEDVILNYENLNIVVGDEKGEVVDTIPRYEFFNLLEGEAGLDDTKKILLIYHEDCCSPASLQPLLNWHEQTGLPCETWSISAGSRPAAADVKSLITDRYSAHPELEYVLLVGDIDYLPWCPDWGGVPGDYWYGCISGNDLWPELAVGRLSVKNNLEVQQQVSKILTYSQNPPPGDWNNKVLLVAHEEEAPGKYQGCKEAIRTATYANPFVFATAYGAALTLDGDEATNADVNSIVNAGVGILNYRGHGSETYWGANWNVENEEYATANAHALVNGDKTPIVFSIACSNGALDYSGECLAEAFIKDDDSAVAFLGATRPSYTTPNHEYDMYLFEAIGNEQIYDIGWALNYANTKLISKYGQTHVYMSNVKMYLWLGDPALSVNMVLPNSPPTTPDTPSGQVKGYTDNLYSYSTTTTDPDKDQVKYTFDWGDGTNSDTSFVSSGTSATLTHSWRRPGTYYITVRATDVEGENSGLSDAARITIYRPINPSYLENSSPDCPNTPEGPITGWTGHLYSYSTTTIDPDEDQVKHVFDWGDGTTSETSYFDPGTSTTLAHSWRRPGTYYITAKAVNIGGETSGWSDAARILIYRPIKPS